MWSMDVSKTEARFGILELQNRVAPNDITLPVINLKVLVETLLWS